MPYAWDRQAMGMQCHGMLLHQEGSWTRAWCCYNNEEGIKCIIKVRHKGAVPCAHG